MEVGVPEFPLPGLSQDKNRNTSITDNDLGLEESGGTRSSVRHIYTSEPRIREETGSASSSMKNNSDSSVCNPEEN